MSVPYYGDFPEDHAAVIIPFNAFTSDDPSESATITNLANTDIHIHKGLGVAPRNNAAGITVSVDHDGITGNHAVKIDTSDNTVGGFYVTGEEYQVRMEGTTVDSGTINAWIGSFSIERAGGTLALSIALTTEMAKIPKSDAAVSWNATALAAIEGEALDALEGVQLDHLVGVTTGVAADGDLSTHCVDGSVMSHLLTAGADTSDYQASTDSLEAANVLIEGIPTTAEFELRTLLTADYTIVADLGTVQTGDSFARIGASGVGLTAITDDTSQIGAAGVGLAEAGGDGDHLTAINLPNQTMDIIGTLTGNLIGDVTGNLDGTVAVVTTNSDMRGTDSAATEAKQDIIDAIVDDLKLSSILVDTTIESANRNKTNCQMATGPIEDDALIGCKVVLVGDSGTGYVARTITDYTAANNVVTWTPAIAQDPVDGGQIYVIPGDTKINVTADAILVDTGTTLDALIKDIPTTAEIALRTLLAADYTVVGDLGTVQSADNNTILAHADYGNAQLVRSTTPANTLDVEAGGCVGVDWGNVANKTTANDLTATDIQLCDTVTTYTGDTPQTADNDTKLTAVLALLDDARAEPGDTAPPVNPDMATKIDYLYKFLRNKISTSATRIDVYNDAGANIDHSSTISDDGTDFVRGEFGVGA